MNAHTARTAAARDCRPLAADVLFRVLGGQSLSEVLPPALEQVRPRDAALLQSLCYETLRWHRPLAFVLDQLLHRPLPGRERRLHALLLVGLCQLFKLRIPAHAAVSTTVAATVPLQLTHARGLVNAVLRQALRRQSELEQKVAADAAIASAHPDWLRDALRQAWPEHWEALLTANNAHPPMALRVNLRRGSRADYLRQLAAEGITARAHPLVATAVVLDQPVPVERLPGFRDGRVSVQDAAAQLAAPLLEPQAGQRVLDACAAPGGKTGHLLEYADQLDLLALDLDPQRLNRVGDNLRRLGFQAHLLAGDAAQPDQWWDGRRFDRILLDAPCSASGVIRRHPDIKLLRQPSDIPSLAQRQALLLNALWPLLAPEGILLYITCSVLPEETRVVVADFHERHADVRVLPLPDECGYPVGPGRQTLPGINDMDGFFHARLQKRG